jgi:hypothetical protein
MTAIPPLAPPAAEPSSQVATSSPHDASLTSERQMFELAFQLQQDPAANGSRLANPAALASELLNSMRGFVEREHRVTKRVQEAQEARHNKAGAGTDSPVKLASLGHEGPARESLEPIDGDPAESNLAKIDQWADKAIDEMYDSMMLSFETSWIGGVVSRASSSLRTLLSGQ